MRSAWFLLIGVLGCDPPTTCERAAEADPSLVLGQGLQTYERVKEGELLGVESGPQGGQHVWGAMEATGLAPGNFSLISVDETAPEAFVVLLDPESGAEVGRGQRQGVPWAGDEQRSQGVGIQVYLEGGWQEGPTTVLMQGEAIDSCGTTVTAEQLVRLR